MPNDYSADDIKAAFWKTFHKSGERWFDYFGSETESTWEEFAENLSPCLVGKHDWKHVTMEVSGYTERGYQCERCLLFTPVLPLPPGWPYTARPK